MNEVREIKTLDSWRKGDQIPVTLDMSRPYLENAPARINRYYFHLEKKMKGFCVRLARSGQRGVFKFRYVVGRNDDDCTSIYCDVYRNAILRARLACTWDMSSGYPLPLGRFTDLSRRMQLERVLEQIRSDRTGIYFRGYEKRAKRFYDPDNFWLDEKGVFIFFQPLTLAPPEQGVLFFPL